MSAKVNSIGLKGLEGYLIQVQVQVVEGVESVSIVGLPDASVKESRERVSAALHCMGHSLVDKKIVVNLSPAEQRKNGPLFDLAIALGLLKAGEFISERIPVDAAFIGTLSLDGSILPVQGMLPAVLAAKRLGMKKLFLPFDPELPNVMITDVELIYVTTVEEVLQHLAGRPVLSFTQHRHVPEVKEVTYDRDFRQIIGHQFAKRALEVAAAGGHHVMMDGPPGCGKSMLAETFQTILPLLSQEAQLEKVSLYQLADAPFDSLMIPPFRHPHHSASAVSIIGGGSNPKPGEVSLAHRGVLFLDELAEFSKKTLDMLRQPLENGKVTINRAHSTVSYPSKFIFIAAMNPCPCGYRGSTNHYCTCSEKQVLAYQNRVSGPIRDRIDILLSLNPVNLREANFNAVEPSEKIRERVSLARSKQYHRYGGQLTNGEVLFDQLVAASPLSIRQKEMLESICIKQGLSNRVHIKIIRLARTISDLRGEEAISDAAICEAFELRNLDYKQVPLIVASRDGEYHG
ncbi:YifB family Mg chelatase-like AAA ATPase [Anaerobacillus isosaccharinicus]|uniref:Magnesium chelatase n=1 Tax=Anaerobacillus isosaccharinicus TaxID=1532552 RepID=A0A1S2M620_9BACI|nr:YifB family Mg chelatase-like AAA ATPase [Anaerobacillus isosaccharinicus]MBA5584423.1 YifB family Mg chelatase-like AAA ATPase [Anaerobacillus isosaccharinicus]QOY37187.1 YifB family Mg chelatase-like AAA ATPase [Anaerobacillus isosaccharinicus]